MARGRPYIRPVSLGFGVGIGLVIGEIRRRADAVGGLVGSLPYAHGVMSMATVRDGYYIPREFGAAFAFPVQVGVLLASGALLDASWGNDACGSVRVSGVASDSEEGGPVLFCDAAEPEHSEFGASRGGRYVVVANYSASEVLYEGDDVQLALSWLFNAAGKTPAFFVSMGGAR